MQTLLHKNWFQHLVIALLAVLLFLPGVGSMPLFDWDEINFAECAREMLVSGNYAEVQLYFQPFWEKPPLFIWMQALCMQVFGVTELAARLPNVLCGVCTLLFIFNLGKRHFSLPTAVLWVLFYVGSLLPHLYFKSGIIDPWFNFFIFLSLYGFILFSNNTGFGRQWKWALLAGVSLGLAVLTKGPVAVLIVSLVILTFIGLKRQFRLLVTPAFMVFMVSALLASSSWFLYEIANGKWLVVKEFMMYQIRLFSTEDADHGGPFAFHFMVVLAGCFPASVFFLSSYLNKTQLTPFQLHFRVVCVILFWVVLILFSIVKTKIVHYSSLCYLPLTAIAAIGISTQKDSFKMDGWNRGVYWVLGSVVSIVFLAAGLFPLLAKVLKDKAFVSDEFTRANFEAVLPYWGVEWIIGLLFLIACWLLYKGMRQQQFTQIRNGLIVFTLSALLGMNVFIPRGELISQRAAIDFYRQCAQHDCYVETIRFKSYAPLFYANRLPKHFQHPNFKAFLAREQNALIAQGESPIKSISLIYTRWLLEQNLDKPAYFVCKIQNEKELFTNLQLRKLYSKNGFSFFVKLPKAKPYTNIGS